MAKYSHRYVGTIDHTHLGGVVHHIRRVQFQSIVDQIERIGRRDHLTTHCTHPFTHGEMDTHAQSCSQCVCVCVCVGSRCQLNKARAPTENKRDDHKPSSRLVKVGHALISSHVSILSCCVYVAESLSAS